MRRSLLVGLLFCCSGCLAPEEAKIDAFHDEDSSLYAVVPPTGVSASFEVESSRRVHVTAVPVDTLSPGRWYVMTLFVRGRPWMRWSDIPLWTGYTLHPSWDVRIEGLYPGVRHRAVLECHDRYGAPVWNADVVFTTPPDPVDSQWPVVGELTRFEAIGVPPRMRFEAWDETEVRNVELYVHDPDGPPYHKLIEMNTWQVLRTWPAYKPSRIEWRYPSWLYGAGRRHVEVLVSDPFGNTRAVVDTFAF